MSETAQYYLPAIALPLPPAPGVPGLTYQPDHPGEAESRLLVQFDQAALLHAVVRAHVKPLGALELAAFGVLGAFDVDHAVGEQLDFVGYLVGEDRQGRHDIPYRAYVKARILANASGGLPSDVYGIARALLGADTELTLTREAGMPAHYILELFGETLAFPWDEAEEVPSNVVAIALRDALALATSGGVSFELFYQFSEDAFEFASADTEEDDAAHGFADDDDAETEDGGALIGAEGLS